jgi:signal transduction histidine kinase
MHPLAPPSTILPRRAAVQAGRSARIGFGIAAVIFAAGAAQAADPPENVTPIAELKGLAPQELLARASFRIRGVVTWHEDVRMVLQDETTAMFCYRKPSAREPAPPALPVERGMEVEVTGVGERGGFGPRLSVESVRVIGPGTLPEPRDVDPVKASEGAHDTELVRLTGVVLGSKRDGENLTLLMEAEGREFTVNFDAPILPCETADLVDAVATVVGIAFPMFNTRGESTRLALSSSMPEWFRLVEKPPSKPFAAPRVGIDALARYASLQRPGRMVQTEGTLIHAIPGEAIYLQDGRSGITVKSDSVESFAPGDRVEVAGFPDSSGSVVGLKYALVRKRGSGTPLAALAIAPEAIERAHVEAWKTKVMIEGGDCIGCLVRFPATLVQSRRTEDGGEMLFRAGTKLIVAKVQERELKLLEPIMPESEVEVTGIVTAGWGRNPAEPPDRIGLLVRTASDVLLVRRPPWWTPRRLLLALAAVGAVLVGAVAWAVVLRRQVALQVARLTGEIEKRREAAIGFRAALAERNRIANNLHDTLLQGLAGAVLQIDSSRFALQGGRFDVAAGQIEKSKRMVQRASNDLRNSVWSLRVAPLEGHTFGESLATMADHLAVGDTPRIVVHAADPAMKMPELPEFVAGNLLLVAQEAIRNAVHHAECTTVDVGFVGDLATGTATLTVRDDGRGFDPAAAAGTAQGHFGLLVMRERMEGMGGLLAIASQPGCGTTVTATITLGEE